MGSSIESQQRTREQAVVRVSAIGIATNVALVAFKMFVGAVTGSLAVILDAVNNLTDALSSVVTIVGAKLASKKPDKKHPLGYGRIEYISAMIVAAIVLYAGITSLVESVKGIINPEPASYDATSLVIIAAAVVVKLVLGRYVKAQGEKYKSGALVASGADALFDAVLSASVLAAALVFTFTGLSLESYIGVVISIVIVKSGVEMLLETLDENLGHRVDSELVEQVKETLRSDDAVIDAFDLILHSYGPEKYIGSVHIEIPDTMTIPELDALERKLAGLVFQEHGVALGGIGIYSVNTRDSEAMEVRRRVYDCTASHPEVLQTHGFYLDKQARQIRFDVILEFGCDTAEVVSAIKGELGELYPDHDVYVQVDSDIDL
jgi:cation diffusion facilitator family transporter